jgi:hypothetical protein
MDTANQGNYPKLLIVQMDDFWAQFVAETQGLPIHFNDKREILTQIFDVYMTYFENGPARLQALPITNRIVDPVFEDRASVQYQRLRAAVQNLVGNIHGRLQELGGLRMGEFPYYVHQFLGGDVILDHMPI